MSSFLWFLSAVVAVAFAYVLHFSSATLSIGRALSDADSGTGFQDAVTPPWQTNFALFTYASVIAVIAGMWWSKGWVASLGVAVFMFLGSVVAGRFLPQPDSTHFKTLILRSMHSRYANYVRDKDVMRADAMKLLLQRSGLDPDSTL